MDKNIMLRLCAFAGLSLFCVVDPSQLSFSTDSSSAREIGTAPRRWPLPSLESISDISSEAPTATSKQTRSSSIATDSSANFDWKNLLIGNGNDLEPMNEDSSWVSGTPSLESQAINKDRQIWWKYISDADRKAYQAQDPETKQKFIDLAQILRNHVEIVEDSRPAQLDNNDRRTRIALPEMLETFEISQEEEPLLDSQETLRTIE